MGGAYNMALRPFLRPVGCWRRQTSRMISDSNEEFRIEQLDGDFQGVVVFAMNRPKARNAISRNFAAKLEETVNFVQSSKDTRALILKSDVPGTFCAGADLKQRATFTDAEVAQYVAKFRSLTLALSELPVPVVAALDGLAFGGGLEIALSCDIRIAADTAKMGLVETRLAIIPGAGGTQRLPRLIGIGKAKELIFTAKVLTGSEAHDIGLVEQVVAQNSQSDAAYQKALELVKEMCTKGPVALRAAKHAIHFGMQTDIATGLKVEEACYAQVIPTEDRIEGLKAFAEKRAPVYKGF